MESNLSLSGWSCSCMTALTCASTASLLCPAHVFEPRLSHYLCSRVGMGPRAAAVDLALSSPAKRQDHQSLEKQQKSWTNALWLLGPCKRNALGISLAVRAECSAAAALGAPCRSPCAAAALENSPGLCHGAPRGSPIL